MEAFTNGVVRIGSQMEGVGLLNAAELLARLWEETLQYSPR